MSYDSEEVRTLVEEYMELRHSHRWFVRIRLMDLTRVLPGLPEHLLLPLVLHYALHWPVWHVADLLGVSESTIYRRAERGLEVLTARMNGRHAAG